MNSCRILLCLCLIAVLFAFVPHTATACSPWGDGCWWLDPCCGGLSCHPGIHKCYHSPRRVYEPCSAGYSCGHGLSCQPGVHKCYHHPRRDGEPCSAGYPCASGYTCLAGHHVCKRNRGFGEACHATAPCRAGFSCQPGVHRCYNHPRRLYEPCSAGYGCVGGLNCHPGVHKCYHVPRRLEEPCSLGYGCGGGMNCHPGVHKCYDVPRKVGQPCVAGYKCVQSRDSMSRCRSAHHVCEPVTVMDVLSAGTTYSKLVANGDDFGVVVISDVQLYYSDCRSIPEGEPDAHRRARVAECIYGTDDKTNDDDDEIERRRGLQDKAMDRMSALIKRLINESPGFYKAVVHNGDNVNYGIQDYLDEYKKRFDSDNFGIPVFSSLGNHDIAWDSDDQDMTMALYFVEYLKKMKDKGLLRSLDGSTTATFHDAASAVDERHHFGSWSYSFEAGKYTFIQVNYPAFDDGAPFQKVLEDWNGARARRDYFHLSGMKSWLMKELMEAKDSGQSVVLLSHTYQSFEKLLGRSDHQDLKDALDHSTVFAHFCGHIHWRVGTSENTYGSEEVYHLGIGKGSYRVPTLYSGSPFWEKFLSLKFNGDGTGFKYTVADSKRDAEKCDSAVFNCHRPEGFVHARGVAPASWNCVKTWFNNDDDCDCGCGAYDPDCERAGTRLLCHHSSRHGSNSKCDNATFQCVAP